jgi:hypothetical protein
MRERIADNPVTEAVHRAAEDQRLRRRSEPGRVLENPFPQLSEAEFVAQRAAGLNPDSLTGFPRLSLSKSGTGARASLPACRLLLLPGELSGILK